MMCKSISVPRPRTGPTREACNENVEAAKISGTNLSDIGDKTRVERFILNLNGERVVVDTPRPPRTGSSATERDG
jgi:hypothetical protein